MRRGSIVGRFVLAFLLIGLPVIGAAEPIRIGYPTWVGFGPIFLAQAKGFFKAQGVDVEIQVIEDTQLGMAALAA